MRKAFYALTVLLVLGTSYQVHAQTAIPRTISYQGLITRANGSAVVDGDYLITCRLYDDSLGLNLLWQGAYHSMVQSGVFSVTLGSGDYPLPSICALDKALWLGVRINDEIELHPLTPLTASPYALNVANNAITTEKIAKGAVTADKLAFDYVGGVSAGGYTLRGQNNVVNVKGAAGIEVSYDPISRSIVIGSQMGATVSTPPPLTGNVDNYDFDPSTNYIRLANNTGHTVTMTGLDHSEIVNGTIVTVVNIGANAILFSHRSPLSYAGNRFDLPAGSDIILASFGAATFIYDQALGFWELVSTN